MIEGNSKTKSERDALGKRVDLTANDVASPPIQEKGKTRLEAVENWLRATLANGPLLYETIEGDAKLLGISTTGVLRRAKKSLGVKSKKRDYQGEWEWVLPAHSNTRTPLTESSPDKASSSASEAKQNAISTEAEQCTPSNEAKQEAGPVTDVQTSPGVGDNTHASLPPVVSTPAQYTRRRGLASAGR
jgi:hypothetical protein